MLIVPAMFENPIVQQNIERLRTSGFEFMEPEIGTIAMKGEKDGIGRLPEPIDIISYILKIKF